MDSNIFKSLVENANEGYFVIDEEGKFLYSNRKAKEIVGFEKNELKKISFKDIIHPNNWNEMNEILSDSIKRNGEPKKFESFLITKNNRNIPIEVNIQKVEWKEGTLYLILIREITRYDTFLDKIKIDYNKIISPNYELSEEDIGSLINKSELQGLLDDFYKLTKIGVGIMDMKGNILAVTNWQDICIKFHRVHPLTLKNCTESDTHLIEDLTPGKYSIYKCKNKMWDIATPIMVGEKRMGTLFVGQFFFKEEEIDYDFFEKQAEQYGFNKELYLKALDEVPRWSKEKIINTIEFLTKFATIISELSYSNLILNKLLQEQENIKNSLKKQKIELKSALDRSDFYRDLLVHDIANVFHSLQLSLNLIEVNKDIVEKTNDFRELIKIIRMNTTKGSSLVSRIGQLSNFGKEIDSGKNIDLKELINNAIANMNVQFNDKKIKILTEFPEGEIIVRGGSLLQDAFENILKNAIIHNNSYVKKIWIKISKIHNKDHFGLKLEFIDNGKGIENNRKNQIFEKGIIQDKSEGGMGIGLSLVKTIIEGYGGTIKVQDRIKGRYKEGSNFILLLK
ncbi:MAG: PocR ligand-binding domain-containing protein [Promethearchaeota archaeon]